MQLSVFSTDNEKSGFRLQYMEVFNWGTFDDTIHSIHPGGETSLLTGANGSGKTTFVDALLTLIVPEKRYRFYNQSSGSEKKGDRSEETYVLGGYGSISSESTGATKTLYLRENKDEAYSIILAHFSNEAEQLVTLVQVRYFVNGEMKKYFGIAHKALRIEDDFKPFDLGGNWKRNLDQRYNKGSRKFLEWFDSASRYAQRLVDALGMQSIQALQLFNQTVGIKVLGNLDEFIRTHMLEPRNIEDIFREMKEHLSTLLEARRNIEKSEEQLHMLQPVQDYFSKWQSAHTELERLKEQMQTATLWHKFTKHELMLVEINNHKQLLSDIRHKLQHWQKEISRLSEEERNILNQIDNNKAGQRLQQLQKEAEQLEEWHQAAAVNCENFSSWCKTLKLEQLSASDEASYKRIKKETEKKQHLLENEQRENEEDDYQARRDAEQQKAARTQVEEELNNLAVSRNNIPAPLIRIRNGICSALNITPEELPFAGELMQVKSDEMQWEPAMEKLLRPLSLRLLVPDKNYKKISRYVNRENLKAKLVYEHVTDIPMLQHAEEGTVHEKLEFHPEHKLSGWVEQQVIRKYNFACINDEKTLDRFEKAITLNGLIKNRQRHEKDDRPEINDPARYVMGWNNEKKKQALFARREKLSAGIDIAEETIQRCSNKKKRLQEQFYAASRIREHGGFEELDLAGIQRRIHATKEQIQALTRENKALNQLKKQLDQVLEEKNEAAQMHDKLVGQEAVTNSQIDNLVQQQNMLHEIVAQITEEEKTLLLQFQQQQADLLQEARLENLDDIYQSFREARQASLNKISITAQEAEKSLSRAIFRIKNPSAELVQKYPDWMGDVVQLPEEARYTAEYLEWMRKLQTENLPKYKKAFEDYINITITYKIGGLNEELERWERDISNSIAKLNESLSGINFNRMPDTYVQLRKQPVQAGSEIRQFRTQLLEALPQAANWQQSSFEQKATHFTEKIHPLIQELDANENFRNRVLDVRNWFEFWADEKYRGTNELKKTYRQMGQLSGGEKAQLTYTILCSAIAYQFGITREGRNSKSLRFIAVDESFSNQDEEKATYLMELCKQLHLQLLVVTPSDKIQIVQDFIAHVHLVQRVNNRNSVVYNMTIKELQKKMDEAAISI